MPPAKKKRAAASRHSLIRSGTRTRHAPPAEATGQAEVTAPLPGSMPHVAVPGATTSAVPPISAIVAELLVQMRAEGLVLRQPAPQQTSPPQPVATVGPPQSPPGGMVQHMPQPVSTAGPTPAVSQGPMLPTVGSPPPSVTLLPPAASMGLAVPPLSEQAMLQLAGTPAPLNIDLGTPPMLSVSRPLDVNVDIRTRQKIWAEQYVEFGSLLQNKGSEQFDVTVQANTLALVPKTKPVAIKSMDQWNWAHQIFVTIVVQARPELAGPLMKYANIVQHIARKAGDQAAMHYDTNFRKWRQTAPHLLPYDQANSELYLEALTYNVFRRGQPNQPTSGNQSGHNGQSQAKICFAFQKKGVCNRANCVFKHVCKACGGPHSFRKCSKSEAHPSVAVSSSNSSARPTITAKNPKPHQAN